MPFNSLKKQIAIWGAGLYGAKFFLAQDPQKVIFFIDKDKSMNEYLGKPVSRMYWMSFIFSPTS